MRDRDRDARQKGFAWLELILCCYLELLRIVFALRYFAAAGQATYDNFVVQQRALF